MIIYSFKDSTHIACTFMKYLANFIMLLSNSSLVFKAVYNVALKYTKYRNSTDYAKQSDDFIFATPKFTQNHFRMHEATKDFLLRLKFGTQSVL